VRFTYTYKISDGTRCEGVIEAKSKDEVFVALRKQGIRPMKVFDPPKTIWQKIGFRGGVICVLVLAVIALSLKLKTVEKIAETLPRRQIYGDAATIESGVRSDWAEIFSARGDRFLAHFIQPGKVDAQPSVSDEDVREALLSNTKILKTDTDEVRQVKQMLNGIKEEARAYVSAGGRIDVFMDRLEERQRTEEAYFVKISSELNGLEEFAKDKSTQVKESTLREWKKRNSELKAMGLRTIPIPDSLVGID